MVYICDMYISLASHPFKEPPVPGPILECFHEHVDCVPAMTKGTGANETRHFEPSIKNCTDQWRKALLLHQASLSYPDLVRRQPRVVFVHRTNPFFPELARRIAVVQLIVDGM